MSTLIGLASSAFARHYLRNHFCFLFLLLLRCFSSEGLRLIVYTSSMCRVAPFGHYRIKGRLHLPGNFRSLPRPSSSLVAKASPMRSYSLPYSFAFQFSYCSLVIALYSLPLLLKFPSLSMNFLYIALKIKAQYVDFVFHLK
jgi:hypothetical protein